MALGEVPASEPIPDDSGFAIAAGIDDGTDEEELDDAPRSPSSPKRSPEHDPTHRRRRASPPAPPPTICFDGQRGLSSVTERGVVPGRPTDLGFVVFVSWVRRRPTVRLRLDHRGGLGGQFVGLVGGRVVEREQLDDPGEVPGSIRDGRDPAADQASLR